MADETDVARDVKTRLRELGIALPESDVVQLARTVARQRAVLAAWADEVAPTSEPAHVFEPAGDAR